MLVSKNGYEKLLERKEALLKEIAEKKKRLGDTARLDPDLPENLEFKTLRVELQFTLPKALKGVIEQIDEAEIIEESEEFNNSDFSRVIPGSRVRFSWSDGSMAEYTLAGSPETDPDNGTISYGSPLGKALIGSRVGDLIEYKPPAGRKENLKIVSIEKGL